MEFHVQTDDGEALWVNQSGAGPTLVTCHGGPGVADYLRPVAQLLGDNFRVVRWDQRGCGRSTHKGPFSLARSIADLDQVVGASGHDPVILFGHSWGASLALQYSLAHPERVVALIYVSGVGLGQRWKQSWRINMQARLSPEMHARIAELEAQPPSSGRDRALAVLQWMTDFGDRQRAEVLAEQLADRWYPINYECNRTLNAESDQWSEVELIARCKDLSLPTIVIHGDQDPRPQQELKSLVESLQNVRYILLRGVGHIPWLEDPSSFQRVLTSQLAHV